MMFLFVTWIKEGLLLILRAIGAGICNIIYGLIAKLFQLFMIVSQLNILSSDEIAPIYQRITLILTIVMVFYITFEFVKYVVQPDNMTDKEKGVGNIVTRIMIAIVLIAFVPRIFTIAYDLQNKLITNQVFSKIILGSKNIEFDTFGSAFSADMLGVFYGLNSEACSGSNYDSECQEAEQKVEENLRKLREDGEVTLMPGISETKKMTVDGEKEDVALIRFDGLMAIIVGGVILYLIVLYTIDVGTRYAQLIFLQIMSPIAIIGYISPKKDGIFQKWLKQCITTYLDLFIRLSIIYFVLLIIDVLGDSFNSGSLFAGIEGVGGGYMTLTYIVLVLGLLVFANKAPKMIGELLPGGGAASIGYGLKGGDRFSPAWKAATGTVDKTARSLAVAGAPIRAWNQLKKNENPNLKGFNKAASYLKNVGAQIKAGAAKGGTPRKAGKAGLDSLKADNTTVNNGGTIFGQNFGPIASHYATIATVEDEQIEQLESMTKTKKTVGTSIENIKFRKQMDKIGEALVASGNVEAARAWDGQKKAAEKLARKYANGEIDEKTFEGRMFGYNVIKDANGNIIGKEDYKEKDKNGVEQPVKGIINGFNDDYKLTGNNKVNMELSDLELEATAKWSSVTTALNEAKSQAKDVAKRNISYTTKDKAGNDVKISIGYNETKNQQVVTYTTTDQNGNTTTSTKEYDFAKFGEIIGDITDIAESAVVDIKASKEFKKAHANAQGASGKSGK